MPDSTLFRRALASCRRVVLLLLLVGVVAGTWAYYRSPGLDVMRPVIETYLKQELDLEDIRLGQLSWRWSGPIWLKSEELEFANRDHTLTYRGGSVAVRLAWSTLFTGKLLPESIRLAGGELALQLDAEGSGIPSKHLLLDAVAMQWRYGEYQGSLAPLRLELDSQRLQVIAEPFTLAAELGKDGKPESLLLNCTSMSWLPEAMRSWLAGDPELNLSVRRVGERQWQAQAGMRSEARVELMPGSDYTLAFNRLDAAMQLKTSAGDSFGIAHIDFERVLWELGRESITLHGNWSDGLLSLNAESESLAMPTVWSWLRVLGDDEWRQWLASMHQGHVTAATAQLALVWPEPWRALPTLQALEAMRYRVVGAVEDLDLALGASQDYLTHTRGRVTLDQDGLDAAIDDALLPRELGPVAGTLHIPWETLELQIAGRANADVAALLGWFGPADLVDWQWNGARADGSFRLNWMPGEDEPRSGSAELTPAGTWHVGVFGNQVDADRGTVRWDSAAGLTVHDLHLRNAHMDASLTMRAAEAANGWQVQSLIFSGESDFAKLAAHFQLPLSAPSGHLTTRLEYDGAWRGEIDLGGCAWRQLLGSAKNVGEPYRLNFHGAVEMVKESPTLRITDLNSEGKALMVRQARATVDSQHLQLNFADLHTPSFSGALDIDVPFADKPWQLAATVAYLNRKALPAQLEHSTGISDKRWKLAAQIRQFDWDEARMHDVELHLSSQSDEIGSLRARRVDSSGLQIDNVEARFALPGEGRIDLRHFSANIEKQHLLMSATLKPANSGGMLWSGFAELHGDFGQLMKLADLSKRFEGGQARLLFSGTGVVLRDQPWWQGLDGRMRLRTDNGRVLEGGTMTTLLAVLNLSELPKLLFANRKDLVGPGMVYDRLQMEAIIRDQHIAIHNVVMRASAFDLAGHGNMDIDAATVDLYLVAQPLQNLDALLAKIPLVRDLLGGRSHSLMRKVYHMQGPFTDAKVSEVRPGEAGMPAPGLIEGLFSLPDRWFATPKEQAPAEQP